MGGKISKEYRIENAEQLKEGWAPEEEAVFKRLIQKVIANGYFWPDGVYDDIHHCVSMWAAEMVITREVATGTEILLAVYDGGHEAYQGEVWHIPGGYNRWQETMQETVSRVGKREFGFDPKLDRVLDVRKWPDEDHALSVFVGCTAPAPFQETDRMRFFPVNQLPSRMVPIHKEFILKYFKS